MAVGKTTRIESPLLAQTQCYIAGQWISTTSGASIEVYNPATGDFLAEVPALSEDETKEAVAAAHAALYPVPPLEQRRQWLQRIAALLKENRDEIGRILTMEHGKPIKEGTGEVDYAAGFFSFCAENMDELKPRKVTKTSKGGTWTVHQRPAGVAALITPWNFPIAMLAKKLSAAIAGGCPSVIKPSGKTPLTLVALFTLLDHDLDLPKGFVNLVTGSAGKIGDVLCEHPEVRVVSFTGSTEVGVQLIQKTSKQVKRLALELGGHAPFIVFDDADLDRAADHLIVNKFRGGGQTCVCTNRVLVQQGVLHDFSERVAQRVRKLKVGNGLDPDTDIGPLINRSGWQKVRDHIADALEKGAEKVCGDEPKAPEGDFKAFYPPTVLRGVTPDMACCVEETFGPLVPIMAFNDEAEAIAQGNNTRFGLAAYLFTDDVERATRVIEQLEFGHVGWNTGSGPTPEVPFGGRKASGYGREGGLEGLHEFIEPQAVAEG